MPGTETEPGAVLVTVHDREDAQELAEQLLSQGYEPCTVHRGPRAGADDDGDADWVIEVRTDPYGSSAILDQPHLAALAEDYGGSAHNG